MHMESGGLVIYYLKLEKGYINLPDTYFNKDSTSEPTSWTDLIMMVEGINPSECTRSKDVAIKLYTGYRGAMVKNRVSKSTTKKSNRKSYSICSQPYRLLI